MAKTWNLSCTHSLLPTVVDEEGIDVLVFYDGIGQAVVALTFQAMGGRHEIVAKNTSRKSLCK
jgi:hypothetical protein